MERQQRHSEKPSIEQKLDDITDLISGKDGVLDSLEDIKKEIEEVRKEHQVGLLNAGGLRKDGTDQFMCELKELRKELGAEKSTTDSKSWPGLLKYAIDKNLTLLVIIILLLILLAAMVGVTIKYGNISVQPQSSPSSSTKNPPD